MGLHTFFLNAPLGFIMVVALLGLLAGSFLNVVIHRLPIMLRRQWSDECRELMSISNGASMEGEQTYNLVTPRSACPKCGHKITAFENIPIVSYLVLRGKCRACGAAIPLRYPLVEIVTALLSLAVAWYFGYSWQAVAALLLTWVLIALSVIDLQTSLLPDTITLPFIWLGMIINIGETLTDLQSSLLGAVCGYLSLWSVYHVFKWLTRKEGMGYGDFKLLALLGAWLGWQMLPFVILMSSFVGATVGIGLMLFKGQDKNIPIPFGPYLALAGWIGLLWGPQITQAYLDFVRV